MLSVSSSTIRQLSAVASLGGGAGGAQSSSLVQCGAPFAMQPVLQQMPVSNSSIEHSLRPCTSHSTAASSNVASSARPRVIGRTPELPVLQTEMQSCPSSEQQRMRPVGHARGGLAGAGLRVPALLSLQVGWWQCGRRSRWRHPDDSTVVTYVEGLACKGSTACEGDAVAGAVRPR
eukprot:4533961-Prymnesium_polylepis.1